MNWIELGDVADLIMGQSPPGDTYNTIGNGWPFFQGKTEFGKVSPIAVKWCTEPKKIAQPGDILISVRAPVGPTNLADQECCIGRGLAAIRAKSVDRDFLWLFLQYSENTLVAKGQGSTFEAINGEDLKVLEVPHYSIEKQRQSAASMKAQLAEVDKARQAAVAQMRDASLLVTRYRENAIKQLEDVPRVPLGELLVGIEAGKSFQTTELIARPDELGVLKVSAVSWNRFLPQEAKAIEGKYQPDERHRIKKGDLIISRANTLELVGAVVRVADDYPMRLLSDKTLRLGVNEEKVLPDFLLTVLKLSEARAHIENNATGTSDSMRNISQKTINAIPVPVISIDKQKELVERFSLFNREMLLIQKSTNKMLNDIRLLPQKILAQAFEI
jgi:type I restriction enzyme S subunit